MLKKRQGRRLRVCGQARNHQRGGGVHSEDRAQQFVQEAQELPNLYDDGFPERNVLVRAERQAIELQVSELSERISTFPPQGTTVPPHPRGNRHQVTVPPLGGGGGGNRTPLPTSQF